MRVVVWIWISLLDLQLVSKNFKLNSKNKLRNNYPYLLI